jgi:hypothetical protein
MTVFSNPAGSLILALEGSVSAEALPEIDRVIRDSEHSRRRVVLDLGEVTLMDRVTVRFIAGLLQRGIEVVNCPLYLKHWISRETIHEPEK